MASLIPTRCGQLVDYCDKGIAYRDTRLVSWTKFQATRTKTVPHLSLLLRINEGDGFKRSCGGDFQQAYMRDISDVGTPSPKSKKRQHDDD